MPRSLTQQLTPFFSSGNWTGMIDTHKTRTTSLRNDRRNSKLALHLSVCVAIVYSASIVLQLCTPIYLSPGLLASILMFDM